MTTEQPIYVQFIDKHFGAIMDVLQRVAAHLGNTTLEIVSRAIPLIVPVPNALGVYSAAIHALQWSEATALALALSVECIFFVMFEITLKLWDGYQEDAQYKAPLTAMCIVSGVCVVLVMWLVYSVESMAGGATVLAALPVLSACTSVGIGLLRWHHARTQRTQRQPVKARKAQVDAEPMAQVVEPVQTHAHASTDTQVLDDKAQAILAAVRGGASTPYAISKATGIRQTTLKRKRGDTYIGRLPALVAAGHLANGGADYRVKE